MSDTYKQPTAPVRKREDATLQVDPKAGPVQQAENVTHDNIRRVFEGALAAVKVSTPTRDVSQNQRFRYELNWQKLRDAATRYKLVARDKIFVPVYYPPLSKENEFVEFDAPDTGAGA